MASKSKCLFFFILILQVIILIIYLVGKGYLDTFTISGFDYLGQNTSFQFSNSTRPGITRYNSSTPIGGRLPFTIHDDIKRYTTITAVVSTSQQKQLIDNVTSTRFFTHSKPEVFLQIDDRQAWMYSAFFDHVAAQAGKPLVRMFGVVKEDCILKVFCNFSTESKNFTSTGTISTLPDGHGKSYLPSYLECSLPGNIRPTHVAISFQNKQTTRSLQIQYPGPRIRNFTVCYSILHSNFNLASQLIESIEMNRILGADHFMVYKYNVSAQIDQILSRYQEDGLLTVLEWPLPTRESWYFSQMTALNDCFYRNRNTSRFVVVADTDEMLIPRKHDNWMDLIHAASPYELDVSRFMNPSQVQTATSMTGCFLIKSSRFSIGKATNWSSLSSQFSFRDEEQKNIIKYSIHSLSLFKRCTHIYKHRDRSKYIARPDLVYVPGIHYVHKFTYKMRCLNIDEELALVNHYRRCWEKDIVLDTSLLKFKDRLYPRIMAQIKRFPQIFT